MKTVFEYMCEYPTPQSYVSLVYNAPIEKLEEIQEAFRRGGYNVCYRYRGSRKTSGRSKHQNQSMCLKRDAKTFSVYWRDSKHHFKQNV